jgi:hypothetical protein
MIPVATAASSFEARVIAARLGADGIVWQFRGSVDGPLALGGEVTVLVTEDDYEAARELLLADEVEAAFTGDGPATGGAGVGRSAGWLLVGAVIVAIVFAVARMGSPF